MSKPTRWQVTSTAAAEIGYVEGGGRDGRSGNLTKFWAVLYAVWQGQPWCGAFVAWVLKQAGVPTTSLFVWITGIFYTPAIVNAARAKGIWRSEADLHKIKPGDIVLFDFDGSGHAKHVGFAERYLGNGIVQTIEGNTSPTNVGSQNNGGGVYRRQRSGASIMGWVDMSSYLLDKAPSKTSAKAGRLVVDGQLGPQTFRAIERWLGVPVKGTWTAWDVKAMQRELGNTPTGKVNRWTVNQLQRKVGATVDGQWGPNTTKALQRWLNANGHAR